MPISGNQLVHWAGSLDATTGLPALVRRLILATSSAHVTMRAGDGVRLAGFDGLVESVTAHNFVPLGSSVWEMGVTKAAQTKAEADYTSRTNNPLTAAPADTVFTFVTPRRWPKKEAWAKEKRDLKVWKDIQVLDADDLEAWLSLAPTVTAWLTPLLGLLSEGVISVERYWEDWSGVTTPPLIPEVLTLGWNNDPAAGVRGQLEGAPTAFGVASESRELSAAFVAGILMTWDGTVGERLRSRTLFVEDRDVWNSTVDQSTEAVLVPLFDDRRLVESAVQRGHRVVVPLGKREQGRNVVKLDLQRRSVLEATLCTMKLPEDRAGALATLGRRSLLSLRRQLSRVPTVHQPDWATSERAQVLIAPVLAGMWQQDQPGDQQVLSDLAGRPYSEVERDVVRLAGEDDPPLRRTGPVWMVVSREDAWALVSQAITQADLSRFSAVLQAVLRTQDPAYDLPPEQRPYAGIHGKATPHSGLLREELADALALIGARAGEVAWPLPEDPQTFVDCVVRQLLSVTSAEAWASMAWVLPRLAEASPESFLGAVERVLNTGQPAMQELFLSDDQQMFGPVSPHTSLLWSLELLAWSPRYLMRVSVALARLARLDPGHRHGNHPKDSLRSIFKTWYRNTAATVDERLRALDAVRAQVPEEAWPLLLSMVPDHFDHASATNTPRWRSWGHEDEQAVPRNDVQKLVSAVIKRLLKDAQGDAERALSLLAHHRHFTAAQHSTIRELISDAAETDVAESPRIWEALRAYIAHQQDFDTAGRALPDEALMPLKAILDQLESADAVLRGRWLFGQSPSLGLSHDEYDYKKRFTILSARRLEAVKAILGQEGVEGIQRLLDVLEQPEFAQWVGLAVGGLPDSGFDDPEIFHHFLAGGASGSTFACGLLQGWHTGKGLEAVESFLTSDTVRSWKVEEQSLLLRMLPAGERTWRLIEPRGPEVEQHYWAQLPSYALYDVTPEEVRKAFQRFRRFNRPGAAFELARQMTRQAAEDLTGEEWLDLLEELPTVGTVVIGELSYEIKKTLDELADRSDMNELRLARMAWLYLPLYRFDPPPKALTHALLTEPKMFAEMVAMAYPEATVRASFDEQGKAQQERAWSLLRSLKGVPGQDVQGVTDNQALQSWVREARSLLQDNERLDIGDAQIGELLGSSRSTSEGVWPIPEICAVVEFARSEALENGLSTGRFNMRGVTQRALDEGGDQERFLAQRYRTTVAQIEGRFPRTAAVLRGLAERYEHDARRNDDTANLTQDRWR